jgi:hypothetical protein
MLDNVTPICRIREYGQIVHAHRNQSVIKLTDSVINSMIDYNFVWVINASTSLKQTQMAYITFVHFAE